MWNLTLRFHPEQNIWGIQIHLLNGCGSDTFGTE